STRILGRHRFEYAKEKQRGECGTIWRTTSQRHNYLSLQQRFQDKNAVSDRISLNRRIRMIKDVVVSIYSYLLFESILVQSVTIVLLLLHCSIGPLYTQIYSSTVIIQR